MSAAGNLDVIVAPALADMAGTVSARVDALRSQRASRALSPAGEERLRALVCASAPERGAVRVLPIDSGNPGASYAQVRIAAADGAAVSARLLVPQAPDSVRSGDGGGRHGARAPLVLAFHDAGRPVRGWHHLARWTALGYAVLALDAGAIAPDEVAGAWPALAAQALTVAQAGGALAGVDAERVCVWGEGMGGALALIVAAALPGRVAACAVQNPFPLDDPALPEHLDAACLAPLVRCELVVGTALMDELAPAEAQAAVANGAGGRVRQILYPKFGHERINDFEDEVLRSLCFEYDGARPGGEAAPGPCAITDKS